MERVRSCARSARYAAPEFQAVLLRFGSVNHMLLDRPSDARRLLESAIEQARQAITEGRDAVQGLRTSAIATEDLARAIGELGDTLRADQADPAPPEFCVNVEGSPRNLSPLVSEEVYRIAGEALRNVFHHAHAARIEVESVMTTGTSGCVSAMTGRKSI